MACFDRPFFIAITLDRKTARVRGFHDVELKKNTVRINFEGPCIVP